MNLLMGRVMRMELNNFIYRFFRLALVIFLLLLICCPLPLFAASNHSKAINVVYDDSGSMAVNGGESWSQAKYALEVFTAMLGPKDILTIYPMSSFSYRGDTDEKSSTWGQKIIVYGSTPAQKRIKTVSRMNGADGLYMNTPIESVRTAGNELSHYQADEKWLIILTDGIFDYGRNSPQVPVEESDNVILSFAGKKGISCAYIAIGDSAHPMNAYSDVDGFFPYKAGKGEILDTVTAVARNVYNLQKISFSGGSTKTFNPDIPMSKIIVFSQGDHTDAGRLSFSEGVLDIEPDTVHVGIAKDDPVRPQNAKYNSIVSDGLNGMVQTYTMNADRPFLPGEYSFTSKASSTEIYFEPGVDVVTVLSDISGHETVINEEERTTVTGEKTVNIKLVNPVSGEYIESRSSQMLEGAVLFSMITDPSGNTGIYYDNDSVHFTEGKYKIESRAQFRGDVEKRSPEVDLTVKDANLSVEFLDRDGYSLGITSLSPDSPILFSVKDSSGNMLTDEEYSSVVFTNVHGPGGLDWSDIRAEADKGVYSIHPSYTEDIDISGRSSEIGQAGALSVKVNLQADGYECTGEAKTSVSFEVDVGAIAEFINENGDIFRAESSGEKIEAGDYSLRLSFSDENEVIADDLLPVSWALQRTVIIRAENGEENSYIDGDIITLSQDSYEIHTVVSCIGASAFTGDTQKLSVKPAVVCVIFDRPEGYVLKMTDLSAENDISFKVTDSNGNDVSDDEKKGIIFSDIRGPSGISWTTVSLENDGYFHIKPVFEDPHTGYEALTGKEEKLSVSVAYSFNGLSKEGGGSTVIGWTGGQVPVFLDLICPEESIGSGNGKYMFDAEKRGVGKDNPFILIRAEVKSTEDSFRPLTEEEWKKAEFTYISSPYNQNILWKSIAFLSRQKLDFEIVPGDEVSTYKAYLSGLTTTGVRANISELTFTIDIKLNNGIEETGEKSTIISVKPVFVLAYIGRLIFILSLIVLLVTIIIMEAGKKRFSREMYPYTDAVLRINGTSMISKGPSVSKKSIRYKVWPPMRAEERDITFKCPNPPLDFQTTFTCQAIGGGAFVIKNVNRFNRVSHTVTFDGISYDDMLKNQISLNLESTINLRIINKPTAKGVYNGQIIMFFRKKKSNAF